MVEKTRPQSDIDELLQLLDSSSEGFVFLSVPEGEIFHLNKAARNITGYACEGIGMKAVSIFPEIGPWLSASKRQELLCREKDDPIEFFETYCLDKLGKIVPLQASVGMASLSKSSYVYAVFRDISKEKQRQEHERKVTEILDAVSIALAEFIRRKSADQLENVIRALLCDILAVSNSFFGFVLFIEDAKIYCPVSIPSEFAKVLENKTADADEKFFSLLPFVEEVISSKTVVCKNDLSMECNGVKSFLAIPLLSESRILGVLGVGSKEPIDQLGLVDFLLPVLQAITIMRVDSLTDKARREAEEKLKVSEERLRQYLADLELKNEELIQMRNKALEASRAKSSFLANMSHEIRTPLNGIMGMCELLLNSEMSEKQGKYANSIYESSEVLLTLLNEVLDISKIEAGEIEIEMIEFDLLHVVKQVASLMWVKAKDKKIDLIVDIQPGLAPHYLGDPTRVRQILLNFVSNAVKFTDEGYVKISVYQDVSDEAILFKVKDTGIGIAEEKQESIFQKFTQADTSTTRKYGGTGLGLAISLGLVKKMQGKLGVKSEIQEGSTFWFSLPLKSVEKPTFWDLTFPPGLALLVCCDRKERREVFDKYLSFVGIEAIFAQEEKEAQNIWEGKKISGLLLDMKEGCSDHIVNKAFAKKVPILFYESPIDTVAFRGDCCLIELSAELYPDELYAALRESFIA